MAMNDWEQMGGFYEDDLYPYGRFGSGYPYGRFGSGYRYEGSGAGYPYGQSRIGRPPYDWRGGLAGSEHTWRGGVLGWLGAGIRAGAGWFGGRLQQWGSWFGGRVRGGTEEIGRAVRGRGERMASALEEQDERAAGSLRGSRSRPRYNRPDERILDDVWHRISLAAIDPQDVEVAVQDGVVTLSGRVSTRFEKRIVEDIAESVFGVQEVHNHVRLARIGSDVRAAASVEPLQGNASPSGQTNFESTVTQSERH